MELSLERTLNLSSRLGSSIVSLVSPMGKVSTLKYDLFLVEHWLFHIYNKKKIVTQIGCLIRVKKSLLYFSLKYLFDQPNGLLKILLSTHPFAD